MIDEIADECHANSRRKGFWDKFDNMPEENKIDFYLSKIALIHSEASEVLEALRKQQGEVQVLDEIADILIRTFDLYSALVENGDVSGSLDDAVANKMLKNSERPQMHGVLA